jgi:hypothetical protein
LPNPEMLTGMTMASLNSFENKKIQELAIVTRILFIGQFGKI